MTETELAAWRAGQMAADPEGFLKSCYHAARLNGRLAILAMTLKGTPAAEAHATLSAAVLTACPAHAAASGFDENQADLYLYAHERAYRELSEEFGLTAPAPIAD